MVKKDKAKGDLKQFERWRETHPDAPFTAFYAARAKLKLEKERTHKTIGSNLAKDAKGKAEAILQDLIGYGLTPEDVCVDYGCGTLRVGVPLIQYLRPGAYWGLDISEALLEHGKAEMPPELYREKRPNLRLITPENIAEAAAAKPSLLFSSKVLQHVHPEELSPFFANILAIVGQSGRAIIFSQWSAGPTEQYGPSGWAHGIEVIRRTMLDVGASMAVLSETERSETKRHGRILVTRGQATV